MGSWFKVIIIVCLVPLLAGSFYFLPQTKAKIAPISDQIENLLLEAEEELESYQARLKEDGQKIFQEQAEQLRRAKEQELFTAAKNLQLKLAEEEANFQGELGKELLNMQLQLFLVSLDNEQRAERIARINELNKQLKKGQEKTTQLYTEQLALLQAEKEEEFKKELEELEIGLEQALTLELLEFSLAQNKKLEKELGFSLPGLRSAALNR